MDYSHNVEGYSSSSSPSLSDLEMATPVEPYHHHPPAIDLFNFRCSGPIEMCTADEVIFRGELLPFGARPALKIVKHISRDPPYVGGHRRTNSIDRCRARRLSGKEYKKPKSVQEEVALTRTRPSWYVFLFGSMREPAVLEMSDIRSRKGRRRSSMEELEREENSIRGGPWKLLQSLSCRGVQSATAASPLRFVERTMEAARVPELQRGTKCHSSVSTENREFEFEFTA